MDSVVEQHPLGSRALRVETVLVLLVSLGASAIWAVLSIINKLTLRVALDRQTTVMNPSVTPDRPWLDLAYQLVGIALALVPVVLALHLLGRDRSVPDPSSAVSPDAAGEPRAASRRIGFDLARPGSDALRGVLLAAAIGIPGLLFYLAARELGINTTVAAANLTAQWWTLPVLVLAAIQNAVLEEVVMVGYLFSRWRASGWGVWPVILASALIRGSYHLYQGFGGFLGNLVMGVVFGWVYTRTRRVMPLVVAHTMLDVVAFIGYTLLKGHLAWL